MKKAAWAEYAATWSSPIFLENSPMIRKVVFIIGLPLSHYGGFGINKKVLFIILYVQLKYTIRDEIMSDCKAPGFRNDADRHEWESGAAYLISSFAL